MFQGLRPTRRRCRVPEMSSQRGRTAPVGAGYRRARSRAAWGNRTSRPGRKWFFNPQASPGWNPGACLSSVRLAAMFWQLRNSDDKRDRVYHCLAMCYINKSCGPIGGPVITTVAGPGKEGFDLARGITASMTCGWRGPGLRGFPPSNCPGWLQPTNTWSSNDIRAGNIGASCPSSQSCWNRCKDIESQLPPE